MRARVVMGAVVVATGLGCSSGGASRAATNAAGATPAAARQPSRSQDLITEGEISSRAADASNALQIIQKLRPQMLRSRGRFSPNDTSDQASLPKVVVDDVSYGAIESLANLNANQVREIRYLSASDATTKWGTGYPGGAILVMTKK
jgi:hypothetical protein